MKATSRDALQKMAKANDLEIEVSDDKGAKTITATRKKRAAKKKTTKAQPAVVQDSQVLEVIRQNNQLLRQVVSSGRQQGKSAALEAIASQPAIDIPVPKEWRCTVKRDKDGFIDTFSLKQVLN